VPHDAPAITIRPIGSDEIPVCSRIFHEAETELRTRRNLPVEDPFDDGWLRSALMRSGLTDPAGTLLALDDDGPVAFGSAVRRDDFWFLAFLFVLPRAQARGVGHALIEQLFPPAAERDRVTLATMVESIQPVSTGLYASFGMAPRTPSYTLKGLEDPSRLPALPADLTPTPLTAEVVDACSDLTRELLGFARPQDLTLWLEDRVTATAYLRSDGSVAGYGIYDTDSWVAPIASTDEHLTAAIAGDLLAHQDRPQDAKIGVLGWSGTLLATLLRAGMRMDPDGFYPFVYCSTDASLPHPAYVQYAAFLP